MRKGTRSAIAAAVLNFWVWGSGYLFLKKRKLGYMLILAWLLGLAIVVWLPQTEPVVIRGRVLAEGTGIAGIDVRAYAGLEPGNAVARAVTDEAGHYELPALGPGTYTVEFNASRTADFPWASSFAYVDAQRPGVYDVNAVLALRTSTAEYGYVLPEMIILASLGAHVPFAAEMLTYVFAVLIGGAFAWDAFSLARERTHSSPVGQASRGP